MLLKHFGFKLFHQISLHLNVQILIFNILKNNSDYLKTYAETKQT